MCRGVPRGQEQPSWGGPKRCGVRGCGAPELLEHLCSGGTQTMGRPKLWGHPNHGERNHGDTQATWDPNPRKNPRHGLQGPEPWGQRGVGGPVQHGDTSHGTSQAQSLGAR